MKVNKEFNGGVCDYHTPSIIFWDFLSEGILCGSFDLNNSTEILDRLEMEDL